MLLAVFPLLSKGETSLTGKTLFQSCEGCHSLTVGERHKIGPNLHGIIGKPAASKNWWQFYSY